MGPVRYHREETAMSDHVTNQRQVMEGFGKLMQTSPGVMAGFATMHEKAAEDGALSSMTKELIALGVAIAVHCDGCIDCHVHDALEYGAAPEQVAETVGVAILMGGGPATVYGQKAMEALEQFTARSDG